MSIISRASALISGARIYSDSRSKLCNFKMVWSIETAKIVTSLTGNVFLLSCFKERTYSVERRAIAMSHTEQSIMEGDPHDENSLFSLRI